MNRPLKPKAKRAHHASVALQEQLNRIDAQLREIREHDPAWRMGGGYLGNEQSEIYRRARLLEKQRDRIFLKLQKRRYSQPSATYDTSSHQDDKRTTIDRFIAAVQMRTKEKINRKSIWTVAGYKDRTEFERFQREDGRTTSSAADAFNRILNLEPDIFLQELEKKTSGR